MALATWELDLDAEPRRPGQRLLRCLVDLDAPCNMACARCRRPMQGRPLGPEQALDLVETLADEVVAAGAGQATAVFYGGEPLLNREQLLAQARAFRAALQGASVECQLGLITNGIRLDRPTAVRLARAGFTHVCVTVGGTRERHDMRRRLSAGGSTYRTILENLDAARHLLEVVVRYELREEGDLLRLPEFVAELQERGLVGGDWPLRVVAQPPRSYARQARALFHPVRFQPLESGTRRGDAEPR